METRGDNAIVCDGTCTCNIPVVLVQNATSLAGHKQLAGLLTPFN